MTSLQTQTKEEIIDKLAKRVSRSIRHWRDYLEYEEPSSGVVTMNTEVEVDPFNLDISLDIYYRYGDEDVTCYYFDITHYCLCRDGVEDDFITEDELHSKICID